MEAGGPQLWCSWPCVAAQVSCCCHRSACLHLLPSGRPQCQVCLPALCARACTDKSTGNVMKACAELVTSSHRLTALAKYADNFCICCGDTWHTHRSSPNTVSINHLHNLPCACGAGLHYNACLTPMDMMVMHKQHARFSALISAADAPPTNAWQQALPPAHRLRSDS